MSFLVSLWKLSVSGRNGFLGKFRETAQRSLNIKGICIFLLFQIKKEEIKIENCVYHLLGMAGFLSCKIPVAEHPPEGWDGRVEAVQNDITF